MGNRQFLQEKASASSKFEIFLKPSDSWLTLLAFGALSPDTFHKFNIEECTSAVTSLLFMYYPNGGIHGLKFMELRDNQESFVRRIANFRILMSN